MLYKVRYHYICHAIEALSVHLKYLQGIIKICLRKRPSCSLCCEGRYARLNKICCTQEASLDLFTNCTSPRSCPGSTYVTPRGPHVQMDVRARSRASLHHVYARKALKCSCPSIYKVGMKFHYICHARGPQMFMPNLQGRLISITYGPAHCTGYSFKVTQFSRTKITINLSVHY